MTSYIEYLITDPTMMTEAPASVALVADREVAAVVRVVIAVVVGREFAADVPTRRAASRRWFLVVTLTVVLVTGTVERLVVAAAHRSVQTVQRVRGSRIERPFNDGCAADADSVVEVSADVDTRTSRQMTWNLQFTTEKTAHWRDWGTVVGQNLCVSATQYLRHDDPLAQSRIGLAVF